MSASRRRKQGQKQKARATAPESGPDAGADAAPAQHERPRTRSRPVLEGRPPSRSPLAPGRLSFAAAVAGLALAASVVAAAALAWFLILEPANVDHERAVTSARAELVASAIDRTNADLRAQVQRLAKSPLALDGLAAADEKARADNEKLLATLLPGALRVRINPYGRADLALSEVPPLTFAGLDQIRRAELGQEVGPEMLSTAGGAVLNLTAPIPSGRAQPAGTLMATFPVSVLGAVLDDLPHYGEQTAIQQSFEGSEVDVVARGPAGPDTGAVDVPLDTPHWSLRYAPGDAAPLISPLWLLAPFALVLLLAGTGLALMQTRLSRALTADLDKLLESANSLFVGRRPASAKEYHLDDLAEVSATLAELATAARIRPGSRPPPAPVKVGERVSEPSMEVEEFAAADAEDGDDGFLDIAEDDTRQDTRGTAGDADDDLTERIASPAAAPELPAAEIFRAYDIRGIVDENLTSDVARQIGRAIGSEAADAGEPAVLVACDGRHSSPQLKAALVEGLRAAGRDVVDLGAVPTPVLYFATETSGVRSGVMVTGSHNAGTYNGFKVVINGETLADARITGLRDRIEAGRFTTGEGSFSELDPVPDYVQHIAADVALAQPLKVVVDCGNGIAGKVMPQLLEAIGCEVLPLYCDVDGDFPNHHPDPSVARNLADLRTVVRAEQANLGIALDGDGDRLGVVDEKGTIVWPDRLLMLFSRDIVGRNPGTDVVFDVKCSRHLNSVIAEYGGRPVMWKTGHSHLKAKMKETGALLGGEYSGHICFGERWFGFDDGLYSAARLLEIVAGDAEPVSGMFSAFPDTASTPELKIETTESAKFSIMEQLAASGALGEGDVTTIDGLRIDFPDGWGLIRPSNTSPVLTLRFEADSNERLKEIAETFRKALIDIDPALDFKLP